MMRVILPVVLLATVAAAHCQTIAARISRHDVEQIRAIVSGYTREPLMDIYPDTSDKRFPGSVPYQQPGGPLLYERTDFVHVSTGTPQAPRGHVFYLQKFGSRWKVVFRTVWLP